MILYYIGAFIFSGGVIFTNGLERLTFFLLNRNSEKPLGARKMGSEGSPSLNLVEDMGPKVVLIQN